MIILHKLSFEKYFLQEALLERMISRECCGHGNLVGFNKRSAHSLRVCMYIISLGCACRSLYRREPRKKKQKQPCWKILRLNGHIKQYFFFYHIHMCKLHLHLTPFILLFPRIILSFYASIEQCDRSRKLVSPISDSLINLINKLAMIILKQGVYFLNPANGKSIGNPPITNT